MRRSCIGASFVPTVFNVQNDFHVVAGHLDGPAEVRNKSSAKLASSLGRPKLMLISRSEARHAEGWAVVVGDRSFLRAGLRLGRRLVDEIFGFGNFDRGTNFR